MAEGGSAFRATVRQLPGVAVLDLHGEIDGFAEEPLAAAYAQATAGNGAEGERARAILLNFESVKYMNSTGIALIVGLLSQARQANRPLLVCGLTEHYQEIFRITRLAEYMKIVPDEESALAAIAAMS
jgi:anti-anti-sigma factor